jgi:hypothetical protein
MPTPPLVSFDPKKLQKVLEAAQKIDPAVGALTVFRSTGMAAFIAAQPDAASAAGPRSAAAAGGAAVAPMVWPRGGRW